eukprot:3552269-Amphidinium_carterae.1
MARRLRRGVAMLEVLGWRKIVACVNRMLSLEKLGGMEAAGHHAIVLLRTTLLTGNHRLHGIDSACPPILKSWEGQ